MLKQIHTLVWSLLCVIALCSGALLFPYWLNAPDREGTPGAETGFKLNAQEMDQDVVPVVPQQVKAPLETFPDLNEEFEPVDPVTPEQEDHNNPEDIALAKDTAEAVEAEEVETFLRERIVALEDEENEERLEAVNQLWYYAADHGMPEEVMKVLSGLTLDSDPEVADRALLALEDLQRLWEESQTSAQYLSEGNNSHIPEDPDFVAEELEAESPEATEKLTALVIEAVYEPDDDRRSDAVDTMALLRHDDAVAALTDVATFDPSPDIRYQSLEALWYAAADGLDADGWIKTTLQEALADPDPDVAALAKRALNDLQALE